jgi:hypothetical protein
MHETNNYREHVQEYNPAMTFASVSTEIKLPSGKGVYCFWIHSWIYHLISLVHPNGANKPVYGQLYIFISYEEATKWLENQSNQGCMCDFMFCFCAKSRTQSQIYTVQQDAAI